MTWAGNTELALALKELSFAHSGRPTMSVFRHPATHWYLEFPRGPLVFGDREMSPDTCTTITTAFGELFVITPTRSVLAPLSAALYWNDAVAWEQASLVAETCELDREDIQRWLLEEGEEDRYERVRERLVRG